LVLAPIENPSFNSMPAMRILEKVEEAMNIYGYTFSVQCPNNSKSIEYTLLIKASEMIMAESIVAACSFDKPMYQEQVADELRRMLPGEQSISAEHCGVEVITER
jgi:hypothetical protein